MGGPLWWEDKVKGYVILMCTEAWTSVKGIAYTEAGAIRLCEKIARKDINMRRRFDDSHEWRSVGVMQSVLWYERTEFVDTPLDAMVGE